MESDFATDVCVRKDGVDPETGGRYLEELSFEVAHTQSLENLEQAKGYAEAILLAFESHGLTLAAENRQTKLDCQDTVLLRRLAPRLAVRVGMVDTVAAQTLDEAEGVEPQLPAPKSAPPPPGRERRPPARGQP